MDWYVMDDFNPYSIQRTFIRIGEQKLGDFENPFISIHQLFIASLPKTSSKYRWITIGNHS